MERNCYNCYWKFDSGSNRHCAYEVTIPKEKKCLFHNYECKKCCDDPAEYMYEGKMYCDRCILEEFGVKQKKTINYFLDGVFIGEEIEEVIEVLKGVEKIKEEE